MLQLYFQLLRGSCTIVYALYSVPTFRLRVSEKKLAYSEEARLVQWKEVDTRLQIPNIW
jgi:hypothetical protein